jgi:hypothetical protein
MVSSISEARPCALQQRLTKENREQAETFRRQERGAVDGYSIQEEVLGRLTWDEKHGGWSGAVEFVPGQFVDISVFPDDEELPVALRAARRSLEILREKEVELRRRVAADKLALHNRVWNEDVPIEEEEFIERMTLAAIAFLADGRAELYYDDGDLFQGHEIIVTVRASGAFETATLGE